nr:MFS transporter [Candidatus Freyarchaeota archaeon]
MPKKKESESKKKEKTKGKTRSLVTLGATYAANNAEMQAFPVYYTSMGRDLRTTRSALGFITTSQVGIQALLTPLWGFLADRWSRKKVLVIGCLIWGITTLLLAFSGDYQQLTILRIVTGVGMAVMMPTGFSLIVDMYPMEKRGKYFAIYGALGIVGLVTIVPLLGFIDAPSLTGGLESDVYQLALYQAAFTLAGYPEMLMLILRNLLLLDAFAKSTVYVGVWRLGFIILGVASIVIAGLAALLIKEPPKGASEKELADVITVESAEKYKVKRSVFREVLSNRTMLVIIGQGVMGYFPYVVLQTWFIHWFETARQIPPLQASLIFAMLVVGAALGNLIGGVLGDRMERRSPKRGRIIIAQISTFAGIPGVLLILFTRMNLILYIAVAFAMAAMINWGSVGSVQPIVSAVNKPEAQSTAWALEQMFEQVFAAFGAVLTGWIADKINFGVSGLAMQWITPYLSIWLLFVDVPLLLYILWLSGESLTFAIALTVAIPWAASFSIWSLAYRTYHKDKAKIHEFLEQRRKEITKK